MPELKWFSTFDTSQFVPGVVCTRAVLPEGPLGPTQGYRLIKWIQEVLEWPW